MEHKEIILLADCQATLIPAGESIVLTKGSRVSITQALGGSVTVLHKADLLRIEGNDLRALGKDAKKRFGQKRVSSKSGSQFGEETVWDTLKSCFDPEIPLNIVDLGLIYDLSINDAPSGSHTVNVKMTLTAQGCGMGPAIAADAKSKIEALPEVSMAEIEIIWDPQWNPLMISPEGRKVLGLN